MNENNPKIYSRSYFLKRISLFFLKKKVPGCDVILLYGDSRLTDQLNDKHFKGCIFALPADYHNNHNIHLIYITFYSVIWMSDKKRNLQKYFFGIL